MISKDEMFDRMLEACPSFEEKWEAFLEERENDEDTLRDELPYYLALGDLAGHLVGNLRRGKTHEFLDVFREIENWHIDGDGFVREAATIGLLEAMQGCAKPKEQELLIVYWLLPETARWWRKLNAFRSGDRLALRE